MVSITVYFNIKGGGQNFLKEGGGQGGGGVGGRGHIKEGVIPPLHIVK